MKTIFELLTLTRFQNSCLHLTPGGPKQIQELDPTQPDSLTHFFIVWHPRLVFSPISLLKHSDSWNFVKMGYFNTVHDFLKKAIPQKSTSIFKKIWNLPDDLEFGYIEVFKVQEHGYSNKNKYEVILYMSIFQELQVCPQTLKWGIFGFLTIRNLDMEKQKFPVFTRGSTYSRIIFSEI